MRYDDYLLKVLKDECPFCDIKEDYILEKWKFFTVLLSRAPYVRDHILIVPNRHLVRLSEFTPKERWDLILMIEKWMRKMETIHSEVNLLLRDGVAHWLLWKSIDHLHFHLVPDIPVYTATWWWNREIFTDYQMCRETLDFKIRFKLK